MKKMKRKALVLITVFCASAVLGQDQGGTFHQEVNWSPDGKSLSFSQLEFTSENGKRSMKADVYTVRADGTDLRKITGDQYNELFSTWSGDGTKIAFSVSGEGSKTSDIYVSNLDGTELKRLTSNAGRNSGPAFSPDGQKIAFTSNRDTEKYQIYLMDIDGKNVTAVTSDPAIAHYNPQWSFDSRKLVYYSEKGDSKDQIWTINPDGSNPALLTANIGHNIYPSFRPDGKVVFISSRDDQKGLVCLVDQDGTNFETIEGLSVNYLRFSPDGKKIAYVAGRFPSTEIYIANSDGTGAVKLIKEKD